MKLSTRGRYGLRAMVDLAIHHGSGSILLKDVASRQSISLKYLEQLVTPLRAAGLLRGLRGANGGYMLSRDPADIRLIEIISALEGSLAPVACAAEKTDCSNCNYCATQELWEEIYHTISDILENRTLRDLAIRQTELRKQVQDTSMYYI